MRHQKQPKLAFSAVEHGVVFLRLMPVLNRRRTHYGDPSHSDALPETAQPINMAMRLEILILVAAILIQLFYVHIYELFISLKGQSPAKPRADIIEVSEFHSSNCEGPPARVWLIRPGTSGTLRGCTLYLHPPRDEGAGSSGRNCWSRSYWTALWESILRYSAARRRRIFGFVWLSLILEEDFQQDRTLSLTESP